MPDNRSQVTALVMSYASGRMTQAEIATACGCSAPYVSKCLSEFIADHIRSKQVKVVNRIIDHIKCHGGRPKATALGCLNQECHWKRPPDFRCPIT